MAVQTATLLNPTTVEFTKGSSHVSRPVQTDEVFQVVSSAGGQVTLVDSFGLLVTLPQSALKITDTTASKPAEVAPAPPAPAPPPAPVAVAAKPAAAAATSSSAPMSPMSADDAATMKKLNDAFQVPIFASASLWTEDVDKVAARLKWPQESKTDMDSSYRLYALDGGAPVLGARAYSMALYGRKGLPSYVSIVFANKGDFKGTRDDLNATVTKDADGINARLTDVLGGPETHVFGPTANSRVEVHRWDWSGHAILLSAPKDEYAAIKVVPTEVADRFGNVDNLDRDALRDELAMRVLKRDNGDVVIQQIPMVDQGPKGYCVPATWERYLRYVDVPADMYVLAMLGNTDMGGGTDPGEIRDGLNDYVESYGRRIEDADSRIEMFNITKFIDKGLPLMWGCFVLGPVEKAVNQHTSERKTTTDWAAYKANVDAGDANLSFEDPHREKDGHMRMIIGYNQQTNELAISDSWGPDFTERWISLKEAQGTSGDVLEYIRW